jgi:hypothetical protein
MLVACKVKVNRHGNLAFRFYWNGREFWQGTDWRDTPNNRVKAEVKAVEITEEIDAGTFNYLKWFPKGNKAHEFGATQSTPAVENNPLTVRQF